MLLSPARSSPQGSVQSHGLHPFDPMGTILLTHPKDYLTTLDLPMYQFTQVRLHLTGPMIPYIHGGRSLVPIPARDAHRVEFSWNAHTRRLRERGQGASIRPAESYTEGMIIDLCHVDMWVKTEEVASKMMFLHLLLLFAPKNARGEKEHGVRDWGIVCPDCEEAITHYASDEDWYGRYYHHRLHSLCKKQ
ncbi:hypothetical protein HYPSUDRAFT_58880 [Hypholoma sublateritium FD-334 SS-4]|uniref:Uncharacterized protein n=1 Tax=Hypholoma sublateritium (strain FD-334 SS-4) TaxID=945553 RepID=A0A0D2LWU0_HYPSF|nr:hypothetical protein HYPSUDRAFT_58880 [Hypholoma sublateritium FD-334 SS-4]